MTPRDPESRDPESWGPEDDELVRSALMSLMDDVSGDPLPEPAFVRARGEGRAPGELSELAVRRSRRRSFAFLAGAAAAAVVATTAGLYVANQSPDRPVATSSTLDDTSTNSSTAAASRLTMLGAGAWSAILDRPVPTTTTAAPDGYGCFETTDDASWSRGAPQLDNGRVPAVQWIGLPRPESEPLTQAVEDALVRCDALETVDRTRGTLSDGATYRGWRLVDGEGAHTWWLEVSDGDSVSFLTLPRLDGEERTPAAVRRVARAVLGEVDLTPEPETTSSTSATETTTAPTTAVIPPPETSSPDSTSDPGTSEPTPSSPSTSEPSTPDPVVEDEQFVPAGSWASQQLTGGATTYAGPLHLEGQPPYIEACITSELEAPVEATGIRSGPGDDNYFGRQYIALSANPDAVYEELVNGFGSGACPGLAIGGSSTPLGSSIFRLEQGDLTTYIAVVRMQGQAVSVLDLTEAKTAPEPLTDSVAVAELTRLSQLAAAR